jgi:uncharacterized protein
MKTQKKGLLVSALALGMLFACTKNEEAISENTKLGVVQQLSETNKGCGYVDGYWTNTSVLSNTVVNASETAFIRAENTNISAIWGIPAVPLSFVVDPSNQYSTYNAVSYWDGYIYFGEAFYRDALSYGRIACSSIMGHEVAHQVQNKFNLPVLQENTARAKELEADGMGGYYLCRKGGYTSRNYYDMASASNFAFAIGDYDVDGWNHHGTPAQRRSAVRLGFLIANPAYGVIDAPTFDSWFFYYYNYNNVLNGQYKRVKPSGISNEMDAFMISHLDELEKIESGEISKDEFEKLGIN